MSGAGSAHPSELLSAYLDDELSVEERTAVDRHLADCEDCRVELDALRRLAGAVADEGVPPPPVELAAKIARRLDGPVAASPRRRRFAVPATIAATLGVIGILVALQWREGKLGVPPPPPEPTPAPRAMDAVKTLNIPPAAPPPVARSTRPTPGEPVATPSKDEDLAWQEELAKKDIDGLAKRKEEGVLGGVAGGVAGGSAEVVEGAVEGAAAGSASNEARGDSATPRRAAASAPTQLEALPQAPAPAEPARSAAKAQPASRCTDRWSDSGVHGTWSVPDVATAAAALDRMARDVSGTGVWWGAADGRPYILAVPRSRFEEVYFSLRARGVSGLDQPPQLAPGNDCAGISIVLESAEGAAPPRR